MTVDYNMGKRGSVDSGKSISLWGRIFYRDSLHLNFDLCHDYNTSLTEYPK